MTIDKAIKLCEEGSESTWNGRLTIYAEQCQQMAEWLKDYKRLLEQEPFINKLCVSEKVCEHDKQVVLDKIRAEIRKKMNFNSFNEGYILYDDITGVLDKYKAEGSDKE